MKRYDNHTHTHMSNIINRDSTNFEEKLIDKAIELNLAGISITDHANLSAHVNAVRYLKKLKQDKPNDKAIQDFKIGLGTEIYLVDRKEIEYARENNEPTKFYHLVLVAKNYDGHRALAELSSKSWDDSFHFRGMVRTPTYKDYFFDWARRNKGNIVCSSACLGSEFANLTLDFARTASITTREKIISFLTSMQTVFGDDFYVELQPSETNEEQIEYNKLAIQIADSLGLKTIITTDAHYLSKDKKEIHSNYLKSQDAERETEAFYSSTYLMSCEELLSYFPYISYERFESYLSNSLEIASKIETYDLYHDIEVPQTTIGFDESIQSMFASMDLTSYPYIYRYGTSNHMIDRALLQQIEFGLIEKKVDINREVLMRLNRELGSLWEISQSLHERLASYYLLTKEIVELMWEVSLVGVSRGSAGAFYICYLLNITQINPIESQFNLPDWRHISKERPELPDIDIDTEAGQRANILELVKNKFGHDRVLNIGTFKTEGTASAIQTVCRGMDISTDEASYLSSLAIEDMTVKECLENYDTNRECREFIKELMNYDGLIENVVEIEGLVCGRSVHASGVYIFPRPYIEMNAMMKAPKGQPITQFDMSCSDYKGGLKLD